MTTGTRTRAAEKPSSRRVAVALVWALGAATAALAAAGVLLGALSSSYDQIVVLLPALAFAGAGTLIAARIPGNVTGWLFAVIGFSLGAAISSSEYGSYALFEEPGSLPGGSLAALVSTRVWIVLLLLGACLLLVFPTGRLLTARWRPAVWMLVLVALLLVAGALAPGDLGEDPFEDVVNPIGVDRGAAVFEAASAAAWISTVASLAVGALALLLRFRRSRGDERQQIKWVASAGAIFGVLSLGTFAVYSTENTAVGDAYGVVFLTSLAGIPVCATMAILKYRLYEIDLIVRKTLVYGVLSALLAGVYFAIVLALQQAFSSFTEGSDLAIAASTLAVAALFRPARRRIQTLVDRRFYRRKFDATRTLEAFSARLRQEIELESLTAELHAVVRDTMQPAHVFLWLRPTGDRR